MPIEGFDYKGFAESMSQQAHDLVPADLQDFEKQYIIKTLTNFTLLAGEALSNDQELNLNADQAVFITQIIAEWSFHKSIDLIHSGILPEHWDGVMQKIAFTIFEVAKQAIIREVPQDQLLAAVEHHVIKVYQQSIEDLEKRGIINEEVKNRAQSQSNIDAMAKQVQIEQEEARKQQAAEEAARQENTAKENAKRQAQSSSQQRNSVQLNQQGVTYKQMKLMSLALVLKVLSQDKVTTILNKFAPQDSDEITKYMDIANLESMVESDLVTDCIREIKTFLPVKHKLSKENILRNLFELYNSQPRERIEKIIKKERPIVKKFIARSYEGEYEDIPLKVAGIITNYLVESTQNR